jgi:hypothetical protein
MDSETRDLWNWGHVGALGGLPLLKPGRSRRATSADPDWRHGQQDWTGVNPGQTLVLADLDGPGVITHIWNTVNSPEPGHPRLLRLRMYWDGESEPSVDCPLGDFFAGGHGMDIPVDSALVRVTGRGRARNCYWPMPFGKHALVTLTNEGRRLVSVHFNVHWQHLPSVPQHVAYFHAEYRQSYPAPHGRNYTIADIQGQGHYVGTVLSVLAMERGWWGEGDELFFVDGETEPSIFGTGTEDYFCDAWGFVQQSGLYYGTPLYEGEKQALNASVCYRWHVPDPITFQSALRLDIEHVGVIWNQDGKIASHTSERADDFASVGFWYQMEPHRAFQDMPEGYARLGYDTLASLDGPRLLSRASSSSAPPRLEPFIHRHDGGRAIPDVARDVLVWKACDAGDRCIIEMPSHLPLRGLRFAAIQSPSGGSFAVWLNGRPLDACLDLRATVTGMVFVDLPLGEVLPPGNHRLEIVCALPDSTGDLLLDAILLRTRPSTGDRRAR